MTLSTQPLISVVTPVLNGVSSLSNTLQSVLLQGYPNLEIIVIDGGSTDGTLDIINEFSSKITYWETGLDVGITDAFNRGIQQASGELIAILNSDDIWEHNALQNVLEACTKHPDADIYYGQVQYSDTTTMNTYIRKPDIKRMKQRMYLFHPAMFVRRSAYDQIGLYSSEYKLAMDSEWVHRAIEKRLNFQEVKAVLATMNLGGTSDQHYLAALNEYRQSLIMHNITSPMVANYHFMKYACLKTIMQIQVLRKLKQKYFH